MHLKVQMRTRRATSVPAETNHLASFDVLSDVDKYTRVMGVQRREAVWMIELYRLAIGSVIASEHHRTFLCCLHRGPSDDTDINAGMELCSSSSHHMVALSQGRIVASGRPAEVVTPQLMRDVFAIEAEILHCEATNSPLCIPLRRC